VKFVIGVDLGQASDYTAFAILQEKTERTYDVRHLERHRQKSYPSLVERLKEIVLRLGERTLLAVDATGVGRPVVDMIRDAHIDAELQAITITAGDTVVRDGIWRRVPKRDLVSTVAVLLQTGRLRVARSLTLAPILERELQTFRAKISISGNDTYEAWRERDHDDLVLAVALAAWTRTSTADWTKWLEAWAKINGITV
jgi:hypothetical protein